jgi:hypothetical protein
MRENVGIALTKMADPEIRERVSAGDVAALGYLEFNEAERDVVIAAAKDYPDPEVSGFSFGSLNFNAPPPASFNFTENGQFGVAAHYAFGSFAKPVIVGGHAM